MATFVSADQPLVFGIDPTLEGRRGSKIAARGIYQDAVRSSKSPCIKAIARTTPLLLGLFS